jgi:hypothetical protein
MNWDTDVHVAHLPYPCMQFGDLNKMHAAPEQEVLTKVPCRVCMVRQLGSFFER